MASTWNLSGERAPPPPPSPKPKRLAPIQARVRPPSLASRPLEEATTPARPALLPAQLPPLLLSPPSTPLPCHLSINESISILTPPPLYLHWKQSFKSQCQSLESRCPGCAICIKFRHLSHPLRTYPPSWLIISIGRIAQLVGASHCFCLCCYFQATNAC